MKKVFAILIAVMLIFSGCTAKTDTDKNDDVLTVVTTIFPQYDFLRQITSGTDINLKMLISPGKEIHGFEATLSDISAVGESDLFVYVGGEDDAWVKDIPESGTRKLALSDLTKMTEGDDHLWTSPKKAIEIVRGLCDVLCEINPESSKIYKRNTESYIKELEKLDSAFEDAVKNGKRKTVIFAERFPFGYLAEEYGLECYAAFEGCSTETEAGIKVINSLVEKVKSEKIPVIFTIEFSDDTVAEKISQATGAEIYRMHSCHNVTEEEFESGETYLSLMRTNSEYLKIALGE